MLFGGSCPDYFKQGIAVLMATDGTLTISILLAAISSKYWYRTVRVVGYRPLYPCLALPGIDNNQSDWRSVITLYK